MQRTPTFENDQVVCAPDGTKIAYAVAGTGPALVLTNGLTTSSFFWQYLRPRWAERHTVLTWDLPGHGRSGPALSDRTASIEGLPSVLCSVMDACGLERAIQVGWSVGCQAVFEMYRQHPERCQALVTLFGPAEHALRNTDLPIPGSWLGAALGSTQGRSFASLVQHLAQAAKLPGVATLLRTLGLVGKGTSTADLNHLLSDLFIMDSASGRRLAVSAEAHSAFDVLPRVRVPLLIVSGDNDPFAPPTRVGQRMHQAAPGSEFVRLPRATHTALLDHTDEIAGHIDEFIARRVLAQPA
jgi:3-oxoadipate enol-lactonase